MSLLRRIIGAFRTYRDEEVPEPAAFGLTEDAQRRLGELPEGHGVVLKRHDRQVAVREQPSREAVSVEGMDPADLRGLLLDYRSGWRLAVEMSVFAGDTPNPNGRLYTVSRRIAGSTPIFCTRSTVNSPLPTALLAHGGVQSVLFRGNTVTLERTGPDVQWQTLDPHLDRALRDYLLGAGPILHAEPAKYDDPLTAEVAEVLERDVLPTVHRDGGDLRLIEVRDGIV
ncbi:MAG: NifU N-terminal domain-containing protein, partial [Myxococcota bacterium]